MMFAEQGESIGGVIDPGGEVVMNVPEIISLVTKYIVGGFEVWVDIFFNPLIVLQVVHLLEDRVAHVHGVELSVHHALLLIKPDSFSF